MNHLQHYLTKLAEECSEVAQIALKTQQFGPGEVMPGQPLNNFERCHLELDDLWAMVEELNEKFGYESHAYDDAYFEFRVPSKRKAFFEKLDGWCSRISHALARQ